MTINYIGRELSVAEWKAAADGMMDSMIAEGVIPADRRRVCGEEHGIFACYGNEWDVVGMSVCYQPHETDLFWLDLLYVRPEWRRRGIGARLIDLTREKAISLGLPRLEFGVLLHNRPMLELAQLSGMSDCWVNFGQDLPAGKGGAE